MNSTHGSMLCINKYYTDIREDIWHNAPSTSDENHVDIVQGYLSYIPRNL